MPIFNIFKSRKQAENKKEVKQKPKIICDIHEKNSLIIPRLIELGAEIETRPLEVGDYIINNIAIERKSASDFISSMLSKRLQEQLNQIQQYEKKLLILEGDIKMQKNSNLNPKAVKGQIIAILTHYNTPIIFTKDSEESAEYIFILAKQQLNRIQDSTFHSRKPASKQEQIQYIIESFPNIGPQTAKALLKKFKSVKNIINAPKEELKEEIGKKADSIISLRD